MGHEKETICSFKGIFAWIQDFIDSLTGTDKRGIADWSQMDA